VPTSEARSKTVSRVTTIIYILVCSVALAGLAEATYLTVLSLLGETAVCEGSTGCFQVLGSSYAKIGPVPVAGLGAAGYFAVFSFATFAASGYGRARRFLGITVSIMFLFTLWLLGVQAFLLHSFCRYCLISAAMVFLLTGLVIAVPPQTRFER
jgi:uncharacterized membrane protein